MITFTYFDLITAIRNIKPLRFIGPSFNLTGNPISATRVSRDARSWEIVTSDGQTFLWNESNQLPLIIESAGGFLRAVAHFGYLDVMDAIRSMRVMKLTTGATVENKLLTGLQNISRVSSVYTLTASDGATYTWADDNSGPTVITEV